MADVFGRRMVSPQKPITADMCTLVWNPAGVVTAATNLSISYAQQITRRRTLGAAGGAPIAILYPSQPQGTLSVQRLVSEAAQNLFGNDGWNVCQNPADIDINFDGATAFDGCNVAGSKYTIHGALVSAYNLTAEAESLTVVDGITIEFLQLEAN